MSDNNIKARLADALHEKFLWMLRETANEIVDYQLSLPGIAVVDLEADIDQLADALRRADTEVFANNPTDEYEKRTCNMVKAVLAQAQKNGKP